MKNSNKSKKVVSALILAAGTSSRLHPLTIDTPKSILDINGVTMLGNTLKYLDELNSNKGIHFEKVIICIGFMKDKIIDYVSGCNFENIEITFIENPLYTSLNNNFSVWLTNFYLNNHDFFLINGDILYDKEILEIALNSEYENFSVIDSSKPLPEDSMKVITTNSNSYIRAYSKTYYEGDGCTVGIHKFSKSGSIAFFDELYKQLENGINSFHHSAIDSLIKKGDYQQYAVDVNGFEWCEIDDIEDYKNAGGTVND